MTADDNPFLKKAQGNRFPTPVFSTPDQPEATPDIPDAVPNQEQAPDTPSVSQIADPVCTLDDVAAEITPDPGGRRKLRKSERRLEPESPALADSASPASPSLADALATTIAGQRPMDVAEALHEVFGRTMAVLRPIDLLKLCRAIKKVSDEWYNGTRDKLIEMSAGSGVFYGYHIDEVSPSRRVDYNKLEQEFPEAYAATVTQSEKVTKRLVLDDPDSD
jgi:hypothetical protein